MNYSRRTPSVASSTVYSHLTTRSAGSNLRGSRSLKSLKVPWYHRPILKDAYFFGIQKGSLIVSFYSLFLSIFTVATAIFDTYCLYMATPGSKHYGYYLFSYQFVYVGSVWVRNLLFLFALFSFATGVIIFITSIILINALRKEFEKRITPWLFTFAIFTIFRCAAWIFVSIVNDQIFFYNYTMAILWGCFTVANVYGWLLVYSIYIELSDLSKLEDLAHLRMGTLASLNGSTMHSLAGSRPTTPRSIV